MKTAVLMLLILAAPMVAMAATAIEYGIIGSLLGALMIQQVDKFSKNITSNFMEVSNALKKRQINLAVRSSSGDRTEVILILLFIYYFLF